MANRAASVGRNKGSDRLDVLLHWQGDNLLILVATESVGRQPTFAPRQFEKEDYRNQR